MANTKTIHVPHLWGTTAGYQISTPYSPSKPTLLMINSFVMTSDLYRSQFANPTFSQSINLLAVEPYGHGLTRTDCPTYTYWDTAIMTLQVLDALNIKGPVFALGTSQGGFLVTRMALLKPERIGGLILLGTSMDSESDASRERGNTDLPGSLSGPVQMFAQAIPDFVPPPPLVELTLQSGFGPTLDPADADFWRGELNRNYSGDEGRKRLRACMVNLLDRDGLHNRLVDIKCPVLWLQGSEDVVYSVNNAEYEIELFVNAKRRQVRVVEGGAHYLSASKPREVDEMVLEFVKAHA